MASIDRPPPIAPPLRFAPASALICGVVIALATACGCESRPGPSVEPTPTVFSSTRAWQHLEALVEIGPRHSGSRGSRETREYLTRELVALGLKPVHETFRDATPIGEIEFTNVYADIPAHPTAGPGPAPLIILLSHFDTKRMGFEFVGANDSGSSTAVLLELARYLVEDPRERPVAYRILFADGEEAIRQDWFGDDNTYGSRHHAAGLRESGELDRVRACVVLDMVGDRDLQLTHELSSTRELTEIFFDAARSIGLGRHVGGHYREINDDHLPFLRAGIPSVDLIDFEFGPNNRYWHTEQDVIENCSAESLEAIGRIVIAGLPVLEEWIRTR
jgi:glutaminyl-peptide cyclotransferase